MRFTTRIMVLFGLLTLTISCGGPMMESTGDFSMLSIRSGPDPLSEWELMDAHLMFEQSDGIVEVSLVGRSKIIILTGDTVLRRPVYKTGKRKDSKYWILLYPSLSVAKRSIENQYRLTRGTEFLGTLMGNEEIALIDVLDYEKRAKIFQLALPFSVQPRDPWEPFNASRRWSSQVKVARHWGRDFVVAYGVPYCMDDDFDVSKAFELEKSQDGTDPTTITEEIRNYDIPISGISVSIPELEIEKSYPGRDMKVRFRLEDLFPDSLFNVNTKEKRSLEVHIRARYYVKGETKFLEEVLNLSPNGFFTWNPKPTPK